MRKAVDKVQLINKLTYYMQYPFVRYALIVGVLIALCSSLFGATLVLKRFSFIGDGLSHVAFGAMAIGSVLKLTNNTVIVMPVTVAAAIFILMSGQNAKLKGDAAIAMMSVGALAVGYLIMNVFSTSANVSGDVCSTLFGSTSILTLTMGEVWLCIVMSICVIVFFCLFYNRIFAVTFDESFTRAIGKNAGAYNLALAVIIVLAMNLVGSLLITALLVFPALSAMRVMYSFRSVVLYSAVLSVVGTLTGMLVSILFSTPVGSTIVACDMVIFAFNSIAGKVMRR